MECELILDYGADSFVQSAHCSICEEKMPLPDRTIELPAARVTWFAQRFLEHRKQRHSSQMSES
jgi:hypothetical protein